MRIQCNLDALFPLFRLFPTMVKLQVCKETAKSGFSLREPQFVNLIQIKTFARTAKILHTFQGLL